MLGLLSSFADNCEVHLFLELSSLWQASVVEIRHHAIDRVGIFWFVATTGLPALLQILGSSFLPIFFPWPVDALVVRRAVETPCDRLEVTECSLDLAI